MVNKLLCFLLLFLFMAGGATAQSLQGRVISGKQGVSDVFVINKNTGAETKTNTTGNFVILAKPGESIVVYNTKIMIREFMLTAESFKNTPYDVSVNYHPYQLDEVVIDKKIDAVSLGLVPKDQLQLTVAERRIYSCVGFISLDALIDRITGRWRMLQANLVTEKKEMMIEALRGLYNEDEITRDYSIPKEHVDGFLYYLAEKGDFALIVKQGDRNQINFLLADFAADYLTLQNNNE